MPDIFDQIQPGNAPPQASGGGDVFDRIDPKTNFDSFMDQVKDFAREGAQAINVPGWIKGAADTLRSTVVDPQTGQASWSQPARFAEGIAQKNEQALEDAKAAWKRGDYTAAALHGFNYLVPFGSAMNDMTEDAERGKLGSALGKALTFGAQMAAPESELTKAIPDAVKTGAVKANSKVADAVNWAQSRGIPVDAGTATGNEFVKGAQKMVDHSLIGSFVSQNARQATDAALERTAGELANQANPTSVAPTQAGSDITSGLQDNIRRSDATADAAYTELRGIEADPANLRNVQTGWKQVPAIDPKTGQTIPDKFTREPVMEDVPLAVDTTKAQDALRPIRDSIKRNMPITQQRASKGLLALDNIIDGPMAAPASQVDRDLSAIKEAARGADMPELRTLSQGLAAKAVQQLSDAVSEAVARAERAPAGVAKYVQQGDKLIAIDANGDEVSQPAAGVTPSAEANTPNVPTPEEELDRGADARAAQQSAAPPQPNPPRAGDTSAQIVVPGSGNRYNARYDIRELGDIQPSHNGETFNPNPRYPLRNDRNYNNPANQRKIVDWSTPAQFDPAYHITDNPDAVNGPPIVDSDGNVLGGNGRTMIMQRVYAGNPQGAAAYRQMLEQRAPYFGIDPNEVAKFNQPVLVRVLDDGELTSAAQRADAVKDAIDLIETARAHNQPVEDYLQQSGLFASQKYSPEAQAIAVGLRDGNPTAIAQQLNQYAEHARYASQYEGPGLFGDLPEPKNPRAAFNDAFGTKLDEHEAPAPPEPAAAPGKSAGFDDSFEPTPAPPKKTAPPAGAKIGAPAGPEALDALNRGRAATRAKYATQKVLDSLPNKGVEGRQVFDAALWAKDAGIERLREIARETPAAMPRLARAYLDDLFNHATAEGGWTSARTMFSKWENLGPETKKLLFPNPIHRADLDKFFLIGKKLSENVNPSGTAVVGAIVDTGAAGSIAYMTHSPALGAGYIILGGALSKLLHSPAGVRALTEGMQIPVRNVARATIAANRILRIAGDAAQPAQRDNVIAFPGGGTNPSPRSAPIPRAASQ